MSAEPAQTQVGVRSRLVPERVPDRPDAAVLVLHGGGSRGAEMAVSPVQLSVLRMIPVAQRIAHAGRGRLAVFRLLNSVRGWDSRHTPADDARWALEELAGRFGGGLPVGLVGHSLGGRAALLAGDAPTVRSVVALAPWLYPDDAAGRLAGRQVLFVHGERDRVARIGNAVTVAGKLAPDARVGFVRVSGGTHAMLRRHRYFDGLAADFAVATLLGSPVDGPVAAVLGGRRWLEI
ncbi:MAG TPA: alpha/beta hydrolase [Jatrophihabitans sp.]|nr:alpha/beta hydrolase [Jatrophihabitans sp.]